ncbi:MAG: DMT family transporter [Magnetospiraceae bacterium]
MKHISPTFARAMPLVFVLLWSSGFIGAKYGVPYAEPFTLLGLRLAIVTVIMGGVCVVYRVPWPRRRDVVWRAAIIGILMHGGYLGGVFAAISLGMSVGLAALFVGLQPLLTALLAGPMFGERLSLRQWGGLGLGFVGVALVVSGKTSFDGVEPLAFLFIAIALVGISSGTLFQKRYGTEIEMRMGSVIQFAAAGVVMGIVSFFLEAQQITWAMPLILTLLWLVFGLSIGAVFLLYILIRDGEAARVASLFYLVPPVSAIMAFLLFGETMDGPTLGGLAATVVGVALVQKR